MKLFAKNKFVWTEPWFFCQRIRDSKVWLWAVLPAILVALIITVALFFEGRQNMDWWKIIGLGLAAGLVVQFGMEAAYLNREVTIDDDSIHAFGNAGQITSSQNFPLSQITAVQIRRSNEIGFNFSMLIIDLGAKRGIVGIPNSIRLERLAQTLHQLKIPVTLSNWTPAVDLDWDQNQYVYIAPETPPPQLAKVAAIPVATRGCLWTKAIWSSSSDDSPSPSPSSLPSRPMSTHSSLPSTAPIVTRGEGKGGKEDEVY